MSTVVAWSTEYGFIADNWRPLLEKKLRLYQWQCLPAKHKEALAGPDSTPVHVSPHFYVRDLKSGCPNATSHAAAHLPHRPHADRSLQRERAVPVLRGVAYQTQEHLFGVCPRFKPIRSH